MAEQGLTRNQIIAELARSPHRDLAAYAGTALRAMADDPDFYAHLVAWTAKHGRVLDAQVALPTLALAGPRDPWFVDNALAHMAALEPRRFARAVAFAKDLKNGVPALEAGHTSKGRALAARPAVAPQPVPMRVVRRLVERYLREGEADHRSWERAIVQHRHPLNALYRTHHIKPAPWVDVALCKGHAPAGVLHDIKQLASLPPDDAAGVIVGRKIPFLIAAGALQSRFREPALLRALIARMSPTELVTNMRMLERAGVRSDAALRGELEQALARAGAAKAPRSALKAGRAAAAQAADSPLRDKLQALQERQLDRMAVTGDWLVLGDRSGSMSESIAVATEIAALLARMAGGHVHLVFFNTTPTYVDATGQSLDALQARAGRITASGGTSIGCGVALAQARGLAVDGIAIVSDGGDNTVPYFHAAYAAYCDFVGKAVPVYLYRVAGDRNHLADYCAKAGIDLHVFDLSNKSPDYYSLPELAATMRTNRYALGDEIMETPLRTLDGVLPRTTNHAVVASFAAVGA